MITSWVKEVATIPVMVKLTPNVTDIAAIARAAVNGGADALSLINTVNSLMGVDLDTLAPKPAVRGEGSHGGYCGPAIKPIALHMVSVLAGDPKVNVPISGIGGIQAWQDAVEFMLVGAATVQVCTAVMHYGFRIVEQLQSGLEAWMLEKGFHRLQDFVGRSVPRIKSWGELDLNYKIVAEISQNRCIHCGLCYIACEDGAHQSIRREQVALSEFLRRNGHQTHVVRSGGFDILPGAGGDTINVYRIKEDTCVGCNLCSLVCPVEGCITMKEIDTGKPSLSWNEYQALLAEGKMDKIRPPEHV
jgi:dihydropyrimidine dehydrogenase (NAD+) subunit PreA